MMFYFVLLAATLFTFVACRALLQEPHRLFLAGDPRGRGGRPRRRHRHLPLQVRGDDLRRHESLAGVFYAFYYNNLFPDQVFNILRSIEIVLGPIIGGIGTLFGPFVGASS